MCCEHVLGQANSTQHVLSTRVPKRADRARPNTCCQHVFQDGREACHDRAPPIGIFWPVPLPSTGLVEASIDITPAHALAMNPRDYPTIHALRRNGIGARILVALERIGPATIAQLAAATGASAQRIDRAIRGHLRDCKPGHSLLGLRMIRRTDERPRRVVLTARGERWAARVRRGLHHEEGVVRVYRRSSARRSRYMC
jgi:hypothetical protein